MRCYTCAEQEADRVAVALCRNCYAGLCMKHLRETAQALGEEHRACADMSNACPHETWATSNTVLAGA